MIFWMGAGIDGVFTLSISLMWAEHVSLELAILLGGSILAHGASAKCSLPLLRV